MRHVQLVCLVGLALCACRSNGYNSSSTASKTQDYDRGNTPGTRGGYTYSSTETDSGSMHDELDQGSSTKSTYEVPHEQNKNVDSPMKHWSGSDKLFVEQAGQGGLFEVETARLALQKDVSTRHKEFAQMMIDDHGKANAKLCEILKKKGVSCTTTLDADHRRELDALRGLEGPDFERRFFAVQVKAHDDAIALFERASSDCEDAELKSFASSTLPTLREHRKHLDRIDV